MKYSNSCLDYTPLEIRHVWENLLECHKTETGPRHLIFMFYKWIAQNISFDVELFSGEANTEFRTKTYHRKQCPGQTAVRTKKAVCIGFVDLMYHLCCLSKIPCAKIPGHVKGVDYIPGTTVDPECPNHVWNAVLVDGSWHLVDVTWGAGYIDKATGTFRQSYTPHYLFTSPEDFILDHRPLDSKWQLLDDTVSLDEFATQPSFGLTFIKHKLELTGCVRGQNNICLGESLTVRLKSSDQMRNEILSSTIGELRHSESGICLPDSCMLLTQTSSSELVIIITPPFPGLFLSHLSAEHGLKSLLTFQLNVQMNSTQREQCFIPKPYIIFRNVPTTTIEKIQVESMTTPNRNVYHLNISTCHPYESKNLKCHVVYIRDLDQMRLFGICSVICDDKVIKVQLRNELSGVHKIILYAKCQEQFVYKRLVSLIVYLH